MTYRKDLKYIFSIIKKRCFFIITYIFPILAIIISLFSFLYTKFTYDDRKANIELQINLNKYKNLAEYEKKMELYFKNNSVDLIRMFGRIKGYNFLNDNKELVEYIYLTKVTYDLVNDSYEQFFIRNNIQNIYNDVGRAVNINDVFFLSNILWNINNFDDINNIAVDKIIENLTSINILLKKDKLNILIETIRNEKQIIAEKINVLYNKAIIKNNLDKELIEEYYKLNDYNNGLTLIQKDLFNSGEYEKIDLIESYLNTFFSSILFEYFIDELANNKK